MDLCQDKCIHEENVDHVNRNLPESEVIKDAADIFKALGDPGRLKIVTALLHSELCVCDIATVCRMSESAISHQLRILRTMRIIRNRRDGKMVFYNLDDEHIINLIASTLKHAGGHQHK